MREELEQAEGLHLGPKPHLWPQPSSADEATKATKTSALLNPVVNSQSSCYLA